MTERLTQLLRDEAQDLDIPAPRADSVLGRGRSLRRRRRATALVAAAAVVGVVGVGAAMAVDAAHDGDGQSTTTAMSAVERYLSGGAYAVGSTIHFGDPANDPVTLDEKVKALYYTSDGILVRTGKTPWSDDAGPSHYSLVTPTGRVKRLDLDLGDRVPATDPHGSRLVYADGADGHWEIVVRDVSTDKEVTRVPFEGSFTWGGWEAPPVALAGDTAYVGMDDDTLAVDLSTGDVAPVPELPKSEMPESNGGRFVVTDYATTMEVVDLASDETLLQVDLEKGHSFGELSPDGRYLKVVLEEGVDANGETQIQEPGFEVYAVDTGEHHSFDQGSWDFGWTPDGHLLKVTDDEVTVCQPTTGDCTTQDRPSGKGEIKIAGMSYES